MGLQSNMPMAKSFGIITGNAIDLVGQQLSGQMASVSGIKVGYYTG
jgi:hypothetical protein